MRALEAKSNEPHLLDYDAEMWLAQRAPAFALPTPEQYKALVEEAAIGYFNPDELAVRFRMSRDVLEALKVTHEFQADVLEKRRKQDEGLGPSRLHARKVVRKALTAIDGMLDDADLHPATKLKAIKELREVAGLSAGSAGDGQGATIALQINTNLGIGASRTGVYRAEAIMDSIGDLLE